MKILEVITSFDVGGAERLLGNRLCAFRSMGYDDEIEVNYLKGHGLLTEQYNSFAKISKINLLFPFIKKFREADVIHAHLLHAVLLCGFFGIFLRKKIIITLHNNYYRNDWRDVYIFGLIRLLCHLLPRGTLVVGISRCVSQFAVNTIKLPKSMVRTIENGVESMIYPEKSFIRAKLGVSKGKMIALCVGRLESQKRPDWSIKAYASLSDRRAWELWFVGEGKLKEAMQGLASDLGVSASVKFIGAVANVEAYYAIADVLLLPSKFEGFGLVVIEALRAGIPVIASNLEGPAEIMTSGRDGILFPPDDIKAFVDAWSSFDLKLSVFDKNDRSREIMLERYTMNKYSIRIHNLYVSAFAS